MSSWIGNMLGSWSGSITQGITSELNNPQNAEELANAIKTFVSNLGSNLDVNGTSSAEWFSQKGLEFIQGFNAEGLSGAGAEKITAAFLELFTNLNTSAIGNSAGSKMNDGLQSLLSSFNISDLSSRFGDEASTGAMGFFENFNTSAIGSSIGSEINEGTNSFFNGLKAETIATRAGQEFSTISHEFLKNVDTSRFANTAGLKANDGLNSLFDGLNTAEVAARAGDEFKEALKAFTTEARQGINEGIENTVGEAAKALSWNTLPYIALGIVVVSGLPLALQYFYYRAKHNIGKPKVATEVRPHTILTPITSAIFQQKKTQPIYNESLTRRVTDLTNSVKNIRKNNGYFQNVLFYGPGGTGKTMISEFIAKNSGMSYIKMSGGNLAQFIKRGEHVTELNKILDTMETSWRPWSNRPWIFFIDEAESLCRDRSKIPTAELLELQNAFLNRTGTQTKKFMLVLATNRMEDLDEAILSRMDHKIFIGAPEEEERRRIIASYVPEFFSKAEQAAFFTESQVATMAANTEGLTGRALFKLLNAISGKKAATSDCKLTQDIIDITVKDMMDQEAEVLKRREKKALSENVREPKEQLKVEDQPKMTPTSPTDWRETLQTKWEKLSSSVRTKMSAFKMPL